MTGPAGEALDFPRFREHLERELAVDLSGRGPDDRIGDDLELDSMQRIEALVAVEGLGVHLDDDAVAAEETLGALHRRYLAARSDGT